MEIHHVKVPQYGKRKVNRAHTGVSVGWDLPHFNKQLKSDLSSLSTVRIDHSHQIGPDSSRALTGSATYVHFYMRPEHIWVTSCLIFALWIILEPYCTCFLSVARFVSGLLSESFFFPLCFWRFACFCFLEFSFTSLNFVFFHLQALCSAFWYNLETEGAERTSELTLERKQIIKHTWSELKPQQQDQHIYDTGLHTSLILLQLSDL